MNNIKEKRNILIISGVVVAIIAIPLIATLADKNKHIEIAQAPVSEQTSSKEIQAKINVPEIVIDKPTSSEASSATSSKEVVVDRTTTSKPVVSSKPSIPEKPKAPAVSKPTAPKNSDGIDPEIQKILDDAGLSGTTNEGFTEGTTGPADDSYGSGGYH